MKNFRFIQLDQLRSNKKNIHLTRIDLKKLVGKNSIRYLTAEMRGKWVEAMHSDMMILLTFVLTIDMLLVFILALVSFSASSIAAKWNK